MDESNDQRAEDPGAELNEADAAPTIEQPSGVGDATVEQAAIPPTPAPGALFPPVFTSGGPESPLPTPPVGTPPLTPPAGFPPYPYPYPAAGQVPPGGFATPAAGGAGGSGGGPSWLPPSGPSDPWFPVAPMPEPPPGRGRRGVALLLVAALVAGGVGAALGSAFSGNSANNSNALLTPAASSPTASTTPPTGALSTAVIARLVSPSVVNIETVVATPSGEPQQQAAGTGMIVSSDGIVLTNNHVVEDAQTIRVAIAGHGTHVATVLGTAKNSDVALIKVSGVSGLSPISLGNSSAVAVGQPVVALGNALGLDGPPSTAPGYISAVSQSITANGDGGPTSSSETLHGLLETNAQIQPGDSGGPLVNSKGQVIGMDTAAASGDTGSSLGFAIPINTARSIALDIEHHDATASNGIVIGLTPYIGVWLSESGSAGNSFGAFGGQSFGLGGNTGTCANNSGTGNTGVTGVGVLYVTSGGPSAQAGLMSGDVITSIAGHPTTSQTGLEKVVSGLKQGQAVPVDYTNSCGTAHTTHVTVGGIPA